MNYQKLIEQLSNSSEPWKQDLVSPTSDEFQRLLEQISVPTTANLIQLLNFAVESMESDEIYCQIGIKEATTLTGALLNHPNCMAYAVDGFDPENQTESFENILGCLNSFNLSEQVFLCDQNPEEFLLELRQIEAKNNIGVCFYNWETDYSAILSSLLLIKPLLSNQALIIINEGNPENVQQAITDFIAITPEFKLELELLNIPNSLECDHQKIMILSWDLRRESNSEDVEAWLYLGKLSYERGNYQEAIQIYWRSLELYPEQLEIYYYLGICYENLNQVEEAIAAYQKTIEFKPDHIDAYNNLGNLLTQYGQFREAETLYRQAIKINPNHFGSYLNLGNLFLLQNQIEFALENYNIALEIIPEHPDVLHNLELAKERQKNPAPYYRSFGDRLYQLGNYEGAIAEYQKLLNLQPGDIDIYEKINHCYSQLNQPNAALEILKIGTKNNPDFAPLHFTLITSLLYQGRTKEAIKQAEIASECLPKDYTFTLLKHLIVPMLYHSVEEINDYREQFNQGLQNLIATTNLTDPETVEQAFLGMGRFTNFYLGYQARNIIEEQKIYGNFLHQIMSQKYPQWVQPLTLPTVKDKIRVGYVSSYLHCYSGSLWLIGWLRYASRNQFEIYAYYTGNSPDPVTEQFRQYSHQFYHIPNNFEGVAEQITKDQLHILVYPEIGMNPPTMELAALRLAPIQCTAWGHPVTSGLPTIDYFLSSQLMEPENAQEHYSETLILLPNIGVAYPKPQDIPPLVKTRSDYDLPEDAVIYLCCQAPFKYLPQYDYILPEIALKVPNAKFLFFRGTLLNDRLNQAFSNYGLNYQDYCLHRKVDERFDYLMLNQLSDVFLDTFTWSGGNTSLEAIACYLPIVTCPGEFMRGRHADSFLKMIGLTETIAKNEAEYLEIAVKLGLDCIGRETISQQMSERQHLLFDDQVCVTALEEFYQAVIKARLS